MRSSIGVLAVVMCCVAGTAVGTPSTAHAADDAREQSRAAFRRGAALFKQGDFAGARDAFAEAYKLFAHPSILLNLGIARSKTNEWVDAEQDLLRFLADDGGATPEEVQSARTALAEVREHLGTLKLKVAPDAAQATLDGKAIAVVPGGYSETRLPAGVHDLHLEADGYESVDQKIAVSKGKVTVKQVALFAARSGGGAAVAAGGGGEAAGAGAAGAGGGAANGSGGASNGAGGAAGRDDKDGVAGLFYPDTRHYVGWGLVGVGVVAAGFGTFAGLRALSLSGDYKRTHDPATKSSGVTFRTLADVSFLGAILGVGIGGYLLLAPMFDKSSKTQYGTSTRLRVVAGPRGAALLGSFDAL